MAQAVYTAQASSGYTVLQNTSPGVLHTCTLSSGEAMPSNAVFQGAMLTISSTYQYSRTAVYKVTVDGVDATGALTASGNSASSNVSEVLNVGLYPSQSLYQGKSSLGVRLAGAGSTQASVMSVRPSASITVTVTYGVTEKAAAPSNVNLSSGSVSAGQTATLSWSGAAGGLLNAITGYQVQRSADGSSWSSYKTVSTSSASGSTSVEPNAPGSYYEYRVVTMGSAGASYYSDPSKSVTLNTVTPEQATPPTQITISETLTASEVVRIHFYGALPGAGSAIFGCQLAWRESSDGESWGAWEQQTGFTGQQFPNNFNLYVPSPSARGMYRQYRLRMVAGPSGQEPVDQSLWSPWVDVGIIRYNQLPISPTSASVTPTIVIASPANVLVSWSGQSDPDDNLQGVRVQWQKLPIGGMWPETWMTVGTIHTSGSANVALSLGIGEAARVRLCAVDTLGAIGDYVLIDQVIYRSSGYPITWTDDPLVAHGTRIKAIHIMEMRGYINALRNTYGMVPVEWSVDVLAGTTPMSQWREHIGEIREKIEDTYAVIGWAVPQWLLVTFADPSAAVMEQIRQQIMRL